MYKKILILGGTGMLGAPVARRLQADGFTLRLLARHPEKARAQFGESFEIVKGDVADCATLEQALVGCDAVHISVGGPLDALSAENIVSLAPRFDLQRITYISGSTVFEQNSWFPMVQQKLMAEKAIRESGVPYTVFCPTWPMEQLPRFVRDGRAAIIGSPDVQFHWFAAEDLAAMVSRAYQRVQALNKRFFIHGPQAISMKAALERYCQAFHPEIKTVSVMPLTLARAVAALSGNAMLKFATELMAYFDKVGELGDPAEANQLLGAPNITLENWIAQQTPILA